MYRLTYQSPSGTYWEKEIKKRSSAEAQARSLLNDVPNAYITISTAAGKMVYNSYERAE